MLRRSWVSRSEPKLRDQLGKLFWGAPGPYIKKTMLLAFVEELGYRFRALLEGASLDNTADDNMTDPTALLAVIRGIRLSN